MKKYKKALKTLLCASLIFSMGISATACNTDEGHQHEYDTSRWEHNDTHHWHPAICGHDDAKGDEAPHSDIDGNKICDVCEEPIPDGSTENPTPPNPAVKHTVTLVLNEGQINDNKTSYEVIDGETAIIPNPTRDGYSFAGWYEDANFDKAYVKGSAVRSDLTLYAKWTKNGTSTGSDPTPVEKTYTVTFECNGGSAVASQPVKENGKVIQPNAPQLAGKQFVGWYLNSSLTQLWDFNYAVTSDMTLYAKWEVLNAQILSVGAYNESLYVTWKEGAPSSSAAYYRLKGTSDWTQVDSELIRSVSNSEARVDMLGLTAGDYEVKIKPSAGNEIELSAPVSVTAYDRSGYAHFNRKTSEAAYEGIGAYNDDGTLKDNALVIYVTDENKDTVMSDIDAKYKFNIPNYFNNSWGNKQADGIGWWLNNAQYTKSEKNSSGEAIENKSSNTYDPNGGSLGFAKLVADDIPICIRLVGKVTTPEGCTAYDSLKEGGSEGDNGHMARMKDLKNVTIEGVGNDAKIEGWGIHFMVGDCSNNKGSSFEVRNITFDKYPEDAVGMEGASKNGSYTENPVSRCWVHNNTFLPGYCASPAESDKAEGDGSCDFKRGEYFTLSYNYFTDCHKTNLIGASEKNYQYNISMHHNWWNNCGSRIPLSRNANMHFYNNYISVDSVAEGISYVHAIEGTGYLFTESNYYLGCKQITRSGIGKSWNNSFYGCHGNNGLTIVKSREEKVSSSCKYYDGSSLENFDTNPNQFYYNAQSKQSDCLLDDSITARLKALQYAGVNDWGKNNPKKQGQNVHAVYRTTINDATPTGTVPVPEEGTLVIDFSKSTSGIAFNGKVNSGAFKGKDQVITFTLATEAEVSFSSSSTGDQAPDLVCADGTVYANKASGDTTVVLPAGTYIISCGIYSFEQKEVTITALSFKSTAGSAKAKLENLNNAIEAIGTVTLSSGTAIANATTLLNSLRDDEITAFDTAYPGQRDKLTTAQNTYNTLRVEDVIAKIDAIGTVGENSYPAIKAARDAYNALDSELTGNVTNYSTLTAAEEAWANIAVTSLNKMIAELPSTDNLTRDNITSVKASYTEAKSAYEALTSTQQDQVNDYNKVTAGLTAITAAEQRFAQEDAEAEALTKFETALNAVTDASTLSQNDCKAIVDLYGKLSAAKQTEYAENATYKAVLDRQSELANQTVVAIFTDKDHSLATNAGFTVNGKYNSKGSFDYNGTTYSSPLKMESSTSVTFTSTGTKKITIKIGTAGGQLKIDGTVYKDGDSDGFIVIDDLAAGSHTIAKASGDPNLCYILLEPAA